MLLRALIVAGSLAWAGYAAADAPVVAFAPRAEAPVQVAQVATRPDAAVARDPQAGRNASGHLAIRGQEIVDPSGTPILLRGWNWGHWGKAVESDAADNAAQGANVVRLPLRWWGYYKGDDIDSRKDAASNTAGLDPAHLAMLDENVRWASRAHLWIVLFIDSNCGQNGVQNAQMVTYCDPRGQYRNGHNFWTDAGERARFIALWRFIANRYKDTPYIGLFEPLPEPGPPGASAADIGAFYTEVMNAIRQVAPGIPFLVGGEKYHAAAVRSVYNPAWKDVVYTGNLFLHENSGKEANLTELKNRRLQALLDLRAERNVPIFVQQVGVKQGEDPDQSQVKAVLSYLNANRVGFTYWEYRGSKNEDTYGVFYKRGKDWEAKPAVLNAITSAFKQR